MKITVICPNCKNQITIEGEEGEVKDITCPQCNEKGKVTFKDKKTEDAEIKSPTIEIKNLTKAYNGTKAVNNISFSIEKGEVFGFLGPNGAGKTTTIKSILGLIKIDSGEIKINNFDIHLLEKEAKKNVGYMPEKVAFYNNLTGLQNLYFYAEMKGASREECKNLIEEFGLGDSTNKKVGKYSKGMVQRLGMARAILGNPPILILDEPSSGLDPSGVLQIKNKIRELKQKGITIFVSSHILSEIQEVSDRVGIINRGTLVAKDSVYALSKKLNLKPRMIVELKNISKDIENAVKNIKQVDEVKIHENKIFILCDSKTKAKVILAIAKAGGNIINLTTLEPTLEEIFMRYTGDAV